MQTKFHAGDWIIAYCNCEKIVKLGVHIRQNGIRFLEHLVHMQAHREPQRGPGNQYRGGPITTSFHRPMRREIETPKRKLHQRGSAEKWILCTF